MCGIIAKDNQWDDVQCDLIRPFICYDAGFSGASRFIGFSNPLMTWPDARTYCQTYHTDLASCLNSADNDLLVAIKVVQGDSWIGLHRDMDMWKWSDGTYAPNIPWFPGQPDNYFGSEDCAVVYSGHFYDEQCTNLHYIFCDTISPMRSQILRLQVKSNETGFDPAVQSSILEQMKQKLKEKGMLNYTTVTWKVQPDGNIFHKKINDDL
ncbi:asialoglycoprotein receptor 1-like [Silurus meridionalis]|nr:asialoglycoprotein receptor 1-like [Silurus meridionalis]